MAHRAPGKADRQGISLVGLFKMFPDDAAARKWFEDIRWHGEPVCPHCGSTRVKHGTTRKNLPFRCRDCHKFFSVRYGTAMQSSKLGYQVWAIAIYLMSTSLKSVSSMKLHRDLGITQKSAWHLAHRLRTTFEQTGTPFAGPVEVDETYVGGKRRNMDRKKRRELTGRGAVGKSAVVGAKDRETNKVTAQVVESTDSNTLIPFIEDNADTGATVYTDDAQAYNRLPTLPGQFKHESVKHSIEEYVRGEVHTNGIESFWSMLKRAHKGTFHKLTHKHLNRYVQEFAGRHNVRELDTLEQMDAFVKGLEHKRLTYADLVA